jgi:hypothetical protein
MDYQSLEDRFLTTRPRLAGRSDLRDHLLDQVDAYAVSLYEDDGIYVSDYTDDMTFMRSAFSKDEFLFLLDLSDARD